jgi:glucan biosynthesis protein
MESLYPDRMNKDGVLSKYINKSSSSTDTGAEAVAAEEEVMMELAQQFAPFDFDLIASRAKAVAQQHLASAPASAGAAPTPSELEARISKPASSL